jgi:hypothetical protein
MRAKGMSEGKMELSMRTALEKESKGNNEGCLTDLPSHRLGRKKR